MHTRQSASNLKVRTLKGKPYEVSLVLAVVVKKLVGTMTVKIKELLQTACGTPSPPSSNGDLN
ncbi:hypothetical protein M422DRAFT_257652 [Sphaerobolus stellatus SS14]|uniref:Uncharacterized protein n=1 Tax=Sphaerobolus stellatus (strain SS14) TaxID=990650 RepID=A0A0C9VDV5_SPHS4|nr:hypothetical protein M422DRAFT_257652 [Sphaerobolus stellatus SS14]